MADWNWKGNEGKLLDVKVYSSCEQVELFLNDKSLGEKPTDRSNKFTGVWQVPYQEGKLKAVGYTGKKRVNKTELQTSGELSTIKISADTTRIQANGQDLSYLTVELTDDKGIRNPKAENLLKFSIEGPGTIIGVGNANPISLESYQLPQRKAWQGRCLVIIKSDQKPGEIVLRATGEGLKDGEVRIKAVVD
jgi:beta-galactosidase